MIMTGYVRKVYKVVFEVENNKDIRVANKVLDLFIKYINKKYNGFDVVIDNSIVDVNKNQYIVYVGFRDVTDEDEELTKKLRDIASKVEKEIEKTVKMVKEALEIMKEESEDIFLELGIPLI